MYIHHFIGRAIIQLVTIFLVLQMGYALIVEELLNVIT